MSKLDELFNEKLTDHSIAPSVEAWEKVEARLSKKNKPAVWLRWAAVFILAGLLLGSLWLQRNPAAVPVAATKSVPKSKTELMTQNQSPTNLADGKIVINNADSHKKQKRKNALQPIETEPVLHEEVVTLREEIPIVPSAATATENSKARASIVLTYTLDPVEASGGTVPQAAIAAVDKKDLSLKRVLEFASTVKNTDSPMGNLRGMKEELFALDLKKKTTSKKQ